MGLFYMGHLMTQTEAQAYLLTLGIEAPAAIVAAWLAVIAGADECLDARYNPEIKLLIISNLLALYGLSGGMRYISSQSAPSGASRSFRYGDLKNLWRSNLNMLRLLDKHGCVADLIPASPTGGNAFLAVGKGGNYKTGC